MLEKLKELRWRVEAADSGLESDMPAIELAIHEACGRPSGLAWDDADWPVSPVCTSLDAALALVERVFPECGWTVETETPGVFAAWIYLPPERQFHADAATPTLALLAALLAALIAQREGG